LASCMGAPLSTRDDGDQLDHIAIAYDLIIGDQFTIPGGEHSIGLDLHPGQAYSQGAAMLDFIFLVTENYFCSHRSI